MIPAELKAWRGRLSLTQWQAATLLGLHRVHYIRLEKGVTPVSRALELATERLEMMGPQSRSTLLQDSRDAP